MSTKTNMKVKRKLGKAPTLTDGDFYFDGLFMVFTANYHKKRGFCCNSGCKHCPYKEDKKEA
jgi:hypothetical protein